METAPLPVPGTDSEEEIMPREHGEDGDFIETISLDDVLSVFEQVRGPIITSTDVADALDCTTEAARSKLKTLHKQERIERRKVAGRVVWWVVRDNFNGETMAADAHSSARMKSYSDNIMAAALAVIELEETADGSVQRTYGEGCATAFFEDDEILIDSSGNPSGGVPVVKMSASPGVTALVGAAWELGREDGSDEPR